MVTTVRILEIWCGRLHLIVLKQYCRSTVSENGNMWNLMVSSTNPKQLVVSEIGEFGTWFGIRELNFCTSIFQSIPNFDLVSNSVVQAWLHCVKLWTNMFINPYNGEYSVVGCIKRSGALNFYHELLSGKKILARITYRYTWRVMLALCSPADLVYILLIHGK